MRLCTLHKYFAPVWLPETSEIMPQSLGHSSPRAKILFLGDVGALNHFAHHQASLAHALQMKCVTQDELDMGGMFARRAPGVLLFY